ncbi:MAG: type II toxin-antitoxin system VapC family toxin [Acidobacteria bacterium]|nr:type II toxin-antitoxin system VapC family toxin [Acidobacteriota bacterium]
MAAESVFVFDACALIAILENEPGADMVAQLLQEPANRCLIHAVSACEVYYDLYRRGSVDEADTLAAIFAEYGLELVETLPSDLWRTAGNLKAEWRRVSLADCFALALAIREKGALVTSDHHELDPIAKAEVCPIRFIR